jgi:hypothetical protein
MSWEPITLDELNKLGRRIVSEYVVAESMDDMYRQLNERYPYKEWTLIKSPVWCGDRLITLVVRPRRCDE